MKYVEVKQIMDDNSYGPVFDRIYLGMDNKLQSQLRAKDSDWVDDINYAGTLDNIVAKWNNAYIYVSEIKEGNLPTK